MAWLLAFVATCAVELAIMKWLGPRSPRRLRVALLAQVATHPFVWVAMATLPGSQLARLACVELWATLVETVLYTRLLGMHGCNAFTLSALANAASLLAVSVFAWLI
jgi:hypothetical protein